MIPDDLKSAILTLSRESIGDFVYTIRDMELEGWHGPRVTAWGEAAMTIQKYAEEIRAEKPPPKSNAFKP